MSLPIDFKMETFLPPAISTIGGKTYAVPGWIEIPKETTLDEVLSKWTRKNPKMDEKPDYFVDEMVDSSKPGKQYRVTFDGSFWNCNCQGFGFRRNCRHVKAIKTKHNIKEVQVLKK